MMAYDGRGYLWRCFRADPHSDGTHRFPRGLGCFVTKSHKHCTTRHSKLVLIELQRGASLFRFLVRGNPIEEPTEEPSRVLSISQPDACGCCRGFAKWCPLGRQWNARRGVLLCSTPILLWGPAASAARGRRSWFSPCLTHMMPGQRRSGLGWNEPSLCPLVKRPRLPICSSLLRR